MGVVGAEDILVGVWSYLQFSMRRGSMCVQHYPIAAGALLSLFLLYAFFNLIVFFAPFLVCVALLLRMFWTNGGLTILEAKQKSNQTICKNTVGGAAVVVDRGASSSSVKQKSRRTNVKKIEWDTRSAKEGLDNYSLASPNDLVSKTVLLAKEVKALNMRQKERAFVHGESSNAKPSSVESIELDDGHSILDSDRDILSSSSSDDESETFEGGSKEEEAGQQNGTKAVRWTDDDQRNLLDLGFSEIERNKRLESLIARRRARKLFKMQIEKGLIDLDTILPNQIAPLYIARNNPYIAEMDGMETPGSAPSVMFPVKNPFDLPYDPLEEKPDLKTDSFQQEFTAVAQKDMLYCRHESFCYGAAYQLEPRSRALDGLGFSRFRRQTSLGTHDMRIERMLSNKGEHDELVETLLAEVEAKSSISHTHIDSISEVVESEATTPKATTSGGSKDKKSRQTERENDIEGMRKMRHDQNVAAMSTRSEAHLEQHVDHDDSNDESTSSEEDERRYPATKSGSSQHAASKGGRIPPKPLNYALPSPSNEKGRVEDRLFYAERGPCHTPTCSIASDLQVEVSDIGSPPLTVDGANSPTDRESLNLDGDFEREYMWAASSSQSSRTEENESKFRDMRGINEKDLANMVSSGNSKSTKDVAESSMHLQQPDELDDTYSLSSTMTGMQADSRTHSMSLDDVRLVVEEVGQPSTSGLSNATSPVKQVGKLTSPEKLVAQPMESSSNPPDETTKVIVAAANTIDDLKDEKHIKDRDGETKSGLSQPSEGTVGQLSSKEGDSVNFVTQPIKRNKNLNRNAGSKDMSNPIDAIKSSNPNQDSKAGQSTSQNDASDKRQTSNDPIESAVQQNLATQEENCKPPKKSTDEANTIPKIEAQDVSQKGTENAAELKTPAEEVGSVSQKATVVSNAELKETDNRENVKQNETEPALESKKTVEEITSVTKAAEKIGSISQKAAEEIGSISQKAAEEIRSISEKASEAPSDVKKPAEKIESDPKKATDAHAELKKEGERVERVSQEATMASPEGEKPAEVGNVSGKSAETSAELKKSTEEVGSALQKSTEASVELKKSVEETVGVLQEAAVPHLDSKKSSDVSTEDPSAELKRSVESITSVSEKSAEAPSELKKAAEESESVTKKETEILEELKKSAKESGNVTKKDTEANAYVRNKSTEGPSEVKNQADDTGSSTEKATKTATELKNSDKETRGVSDIATEVTAEKEKTTVDIGSVSNNAIGASADLKSSDKETGGVSDSAIGVTAEMEKTKVDTGSVSNNATGASAELKKPSEEIGVVSQKESDTTADLKRQAEVNGHISQKEVETAAELKKTVEEIGNVSHKTSEVVADLKSPADKSENVSGKAKEVAAMLKSPPEETGNVSQKATEVATEMKETTDEIGTSAQKANEAATELKKSAEGISNASENSDKAPVELKKTVEEIKT